MLFHLIVSFLAGVLKSARDTLMLGTQPSQTEDSMLGREHDDLNDTQPIHISEKLEGPDGEITADNTAQLAEELNYDTSLLKPEQKRAIFNAIFAVNLEAHGLRSPQYYEDKSQCLSVSETAWPGAIAALKAERLKRGYIEPKEIIKRLRKLKPSNNFKRRRYAHRFMKWDQTPLHEDRRRLIGPPEQLWYHQQLDAIFEKYHRSHREYRRLEKEINDKWDEFVGTLNQSDSSGMPLFKNIGQSLGGTLFPRYLVQGLSQLRGSADMMGRKYFEEEDKKSETARQEAIDEWKQRNPDVFLKYDPEFRYSAWPRDLMDQLDEIGREAVRRGKNRYLDLLKEKEKEMQVLIEFWRDCGLVNGQRTPPLPQWPDPEDRFHEMERPKYLTDRLLELDAQYGRSSENLMWQFIEVTRWKEAVLKGGSDPTAADTPFPKSLMDDLVEIWEDYPGWEESEAEDRMFDRIDEWRESRAEQMPEEIAGSVQHDLPAESNNIWSGRLRSRKANDGVKDQTTWRTRLRPRYGNVDTAIMKSEAAMKATDKPNETTKKHNGNASKTTRPKVPLTKSTKRKLISYDLNLMKPQDLQNAFALQT